MSWKLYTQGRHEGPATARTESVHLPPMTHGPVLGHLERIDLKLRPGNCCRYGSLWTTSLRTSHLPPHVAADALSHHNSTLQPRLA